jgi:hypothetical protein
VAFISPSFFNEYNKRFMPLFSTTYIAILARMGLCPSSGAGVARKIGEIPYGKSETFRTSGGEATKIGLCRNQYWKLCSTPAQSNPSPHQWRPTWRQSTTI